LIFNWLLRRNADHSAALYDAIVAAARQPRFYRDMGVPDTVDGRFDMLVLHLTMVVARLKGENQSLRQKLINRFCDDMDGNVRELGAGDLGVAKKVRRMAEAFQGRYSAYDAATTLAAMQAVVARNIYGGTAPTTELANYALQVRQRLAAQSLSEITDGRPDFS
jgi:cytochrome b pre-mRNA-processing protein 3